VRNSNLGQIFSFGYKGTEPSGEFIKLIRQYQLGGVILFSENIGTKEDLKEHIELLQRSSAIPLFVMIDQEGGRVNRITQDFPLFPANLYYGKRKDKEGVCEANRQTARELKKLGINVNLAPVVDVLTNPANPVIAERSFGSEPELVSEFSKIAIEAIRGEGVLACAKHFPGIGDISVDPHKTLPSSSNSKERFEKTDFPPFKTAISCEVDFIMSSHVMATELDSSFPVTLSRKICTGILREELNFKGVTITDDMQMKGIRNSFHLENASLLALEAGNDLILISENLEEQLKVLNFFEKKFKDKKLNTARLSEATDRILTLKKKLSRG
jgi:beta-N-acetylhexosaminidase